MFAKFGSLDSLLSCKLLKANPLFNFLHDFDTQAQALQEDSGMIHMKPRDPRHSFHGSSTVQKSGSLGSERSNATVSSTPNIQGTRDNVNAWKLEEQNKMFAARKLCIVLDLDHTLLNFAMVICMEWVLLSCGLIFGQLLINILSFSLLKLTMCMKRY